METIDILNVTTLAPALKHPTIFSKFDALSAGDSFVIQNDHDPKPLYYQLLANKGNSFTWEYLEDGPSWWKVKIAKLKPGEIEQTIGELVSKDYRKAEVFKKFGLDFCCGGKKTLSKACKEKGLDIVQIEKELRIIESEDTQPQDDYDTWALDVLADYIVRKHHQYVIQASPILFEYTQKVARVHGDRHPEAIEIASIFSQISEELNSHMVKEEHVLFPYITRLVQAQKEGTKLSPPPFGSIQNPIRMMESEHEDVGGLSEQIQKLSNNYAPPSGACNTYKVTYAKLKEFIEDLHQHIHLENNVLFPKAIVLEHEILNRP